VEDKLSNFVFYYFAPFDLPVIIIIMFETDIILSEGEVLTQNFTQKVIQGSCLDSG